MHTESESHSWDINIPDHAARSDSPTFTKARALANKLAASIKGFFSGPPPYQQHHGGSLWLKDADGWFLVKNVAGIEWSAQFCADPAKVDQLRINARRLYAAFPDAVAELGIRTLLDTPITDAAGVAEWTDSICNSCVPLPAAVHTGVLPAGGGVHHYPTPITDIQHFKHDDFVLWVTDTQGQPAAVVPVAPKGSGDARVQVEYATPGTALHEQTKYAHHIGQPLVLPEVHPMAKQAFTKQ